MKVMAKETLKNAYGQVLFVGGRTYQAEEDAKWYIVLNELHSETIVRKTRIDESFEIIR